MSFPGLYFLIQWANSNISTWHWRRNTFFKVVEEIPIFTKWKFLHFLSRSLLKITTGRNRIYSYTIQTLKYFNRFCIMKTKEELWIELMGRMIHTWLDSLVISLTFYETLWKTKQLLISGPTTYEVKSETVAVTTYHSWIKTAKNFIILVAFGHKCASLYTAMGLNPETWKKENPYGQ